MTSEDDAEVITASWQDPERFSVLFDRHAPHIHRYLARRIGPEAADDMLGETFLAAFVKRHGYNTSYLDARPWLYGIATNLIAQHRREEANRLRLLATVAPEPDLPDFSESSVHSIALRRLLADAIAGLADGDRDVLLLIAWADLSYEEVASALVIPVGTVRSRMHRARARLRAAFEHLNMETLTP